MRNSVGRSDGGQRAAGLLAAAVLSLATGACDDIIGSGSAGAVRRLTTHPATQTHPRVWGDRVVYQDDRSGNWDIFLYDLSTRRETRITSDTADQRYPEVWGDRIVWTDERHAGGGGGADIYLFDLSTGRETRLTAGLPRHDFPVIHGDRVAWTSFGRASEPPGIYVLDLTTGARTHVTRATGEPDLDGDRVVWIERLGTTPIVGPRVHIKDAVKLHDLATGLTTTLDDSWTPKTDVALGGDWVAWTDARNIQGEDNNTDIYGFDLRAGTTVRLSTSTRPDRSPAILDGLVTWGELQYNNREGGGAVWVTEPGSDRRTRLTGYDEGGFPAAQGRRVVWPARRLGNVDVYLLQVRR